jgi:hypothetical protein
MSLVCMCAMSRDRAYKEERGDISYTHLIWFLLPSCVEVSQDQLHDLEADCRVKVSLPSSNQHFHVSDSRPQAYWWAYVHILSHCIDRIFHFLSLCVIVGKCLKEVSNRLVEARHFLA